jgi:hypothetical protein
MLPVCVKAPFQDCGLFSAVRKFDIHTGVDFYAEEGVPVIAIEEGIIIDVFKFTGKVVGTPWWNETYAVVVTSGKLTYVYGEVTPNVSIGDRVSSGDIVGYVKAVLKSDKGITPTSMLHLEVWETGYYIKNFTWKLGEEKPEGLLNPLIVLDSNKGQSMWVIKTCVGYRLETYSGELLNFFSMAADCKSETMGMNLVYIKESSPLNVKVLYTLATGKALWFDYNGKWKD